MWGTCGGFDPTVHCHNLFALLNGSLGARLAADIPVVMTKHGHGLGQCAG
jgi:hypothetical protein